MKHEMIIYVKMTYEIMIYEKIKCEIIVYEKIKLKYLMEHRTERKIIIVHKHRALKKLKHTAPFRNLNFVKLQISNIRCVKMFLEKFC